MATKPGRVGWRMRTLPRHSFAISWPVTKRPKAQPRVNDNRECDYDETRSYRAKDRAVVGQQEAAQERQSKRDARYKFIRMPVKCNGVLAGEAYHSVAGVLAQHAESPERLDAAYLFAAVRTCRVHSIDCLMQLYKRRAASLASVALALLLPVHEQTFDPRRLVSPCHQFAGGSLARRLCFVEFHGILTPDDAAAENLDYLEG